MMSLSLVKGDGVACGSPPHGESKGEQPSGPQPLNFVLKHSFSGVKKSSPANDAARTGSEPVNQFSRSRS